VQLLQVDVLGEIIGLPLHLLVGSAGLLVEGQHCRRKAPGEAVCLPFRLGEGHPAVAERIKKYIGNVRTFRAVRTHNYPRSTRHFYL